MSEARSPLVSALPVQAAPPSLADNTADLDRLLRALAPALAGQPPGVPWPQLAAAAASFRAAGFRGHALVANLPAGPELMGFAAGAPGLVPALALDLGTTVLEASLLDLATGQVLARGQRDNPQIGLGADVLTRIHGAAGPGLDRLHRLLIEGVNDLARQLAARSGLDPGGIVALAAAGNTTMTHFFLGLDPRQLCREPYIPLVNAPDPGHAREIDLAIHPAAPVWVLPSVGSYFGGDLLAGILATGLDQGERPALLVDVGTNAEVVVGSRDWLVACAGAAGPALEGGVARMGMRAAPGAVSRIRIDAARRLSCQTIGDQPAQGICGSGIIDLVAELYLAQLIDFRGRFQPQRAPALFTATPEGPALIVVPAERTAGGQPILFGQVDCDAVIRSKAAMYAILTTLLGQVGLGFQDLAAIHVAGTFGGHIDPRQAIVIGMLPDLPLAFYQPRGNTSLAGAELLLMDGEARQRSRELVRRITYLELNVNHDFMIRFSGSRVIPHTDPDLFPTVPIHR
ncbi:MAG: ASKHA domain-containing protein [Thermodesulfobacteriota bacterium]